LLIAEATWVGLLLDKVLAPVLTAAGIGLAALIAAWINKLSKTAGLELNAKQQEEVAAAIERAILHTTQTFTEAAKQGAADGKLTGEDALQALRMTAERARIELGDLGKMANGAAKRLLEDEKLLQERIESLLPVVKSKTQRLAALTREEAEKLAGG